MTTVSHVHPDDAAADADGAPPMRLLIADDDAISRRMLEAAVHEWGYEVVIAEDGPKALKLLSGEDAPRIALVDWEMPGLSGIDVIRIVRGRKAADYVYTILLTHKETVENVVQGLNAGADDYVSKPFELAELEMRVRAGRRIVDLQTELCRAHAALERRARHDFLTGLLNRGAVIELLEIEIERARRTAQPLTVLMFDLDHFKQINDSLGHRAGDAVLHAISQCTSGSVRTYDVIGRYGGEEFLVVSPGCSASDGRTLAERLRGAISTTEVKWEGRTLSVTASVGLASNQLGYETVDDLLEASDQALYAAKRQGRNRVVCAPHSAKGEANQASEPEAPVHSHPPD